MFSIATRESETAIECVLYSREPNRNQDDVPASGMHIKEASTSSRVAIESKEQGVVKVKRGQAGEGARELFPWTAGPGTHKYFDPEHPLAGDSKGSSLALVLC